MISKWTYLCLAKALIFGLLLAPAAVAQDSGIDLDMILKAPPAGDAPADTVNPLDKAFLAALEAYREKDYLTARSGWSELSDAGHGISMHNLSVLTWRGQGGPKNQHAALELFHDAGQKDVGPSLHALGVLALRGAVEAPDPAEAVRYFEAASALGHAPSTYNLALANLKGIGGAKDRKLGMELMEAAAEGGLVQAQYDLGTLLYQGTYGPPDKAAARHWFERAALQGDPFGHYNLALMQMAGEGGDKNAGFALINLTSAAEMGAVPAQVRLAHLLVKGGQGIKADPETAYVWFSIAGTLGAKGALENAKRLSPRLDSPALSRAKAAISRYRPKMPPEPEQPDSSANVLKQ